MEVSNAADRGDLSGSLALIGLLLEPGNGPGPAQFCLLSRLLAIELGVRDGTISLEQYDRAVIRIAGHIVGVLDSAA